MIRAVTLPPALPALPLSLAVVGAGPVGLALALLAARALPGVRIAVHDARPAGADPGRDPRTLALALGSVQLLEGLGLDLDGAGAPITTVHVSQQSPSLGLQQLPGVLARWLLPEGEPALRLRAEELGVARLGLVLRHGAVVAPLQAAWEAACAAEPDRLSLRLGCPVRALKNLEDGVEVEGDGGLVERFDLAVVAEGGVFAEQSRRAVVRDYRQRAWVGTVTLARPLDGLAVERFTLHGPAALLPLPPGAAGGATPATADAGPQAALVWCVPREDDPVERLDAAGRLALLDSLFPEAVGPLRGLSALKAFDLGLNAEARLVQGRQVRIGNAAQTLHPVAGQGLNLGLRDAQDLVQALADAARAVPPGAPGPDWTAALRRLDRRRAPDRWGLILATDLLARGFNGPGPALGAARGLGLAALSLAGPLRRGLARRMMHGWR